MPQPARSAPNDFFLPDFCAPRATLAIVLIVELVAVLIALARAPITNYFWVDLAALSMFLLWIGLGGAFMLCRTTPWLSRQSVVKSSSVALFLLVTIVAVVSEVVYQTGTYFTGGSQSLADIFPVHHAEFVLRNVGIGFIVSALTLRYFYVSAEWKRTIELEAQSRLYALQARIRPHFLFNSMNTIAALTRSNPELAEQAVEDLADLFRANLSDVRQRLRLNEEIEIARVYERIERLRLGERLKVDWQLDGVPMDALVPSLILQPLLENAVYHGIEGLPNGGEVTVTAQLENDMIRLAVTNPVAENRVAGERNGNKLALDNITQRLQLEWPGKSSVEVSAPIGSYSVTLTFPYSAQTQP